ISWNSSQPTVATVDNNGLVTAAGPGSTNITATADEISSLPFTVSVLGQEISGTFTGLSGYTVNGTVTLEQDQDGFYLQMQSDFQTQSGPGLYVYYSRDAGANTFVDLGKLQATSGEQRYNIPASIDTEDYRFVQIWCQPFGVSFGVAELQ
ncbi:MAG: DM13 domain-containing protein, partial [Bacteroidota bacterium]